MKKIDWMSLAEDLNMDMSEDISDMDEGEIEAWVMAVAKEKGLDLNSSNIRETYGA